jgi:hypothetical protein
MRRSILFFGGAAVLLLLHIQFVHSQTTEFSYQGSLKNGSAPATGNHDFEFVLFDALSAGNQVGPVVPINGVPVTDGTFSVKLNFGNQFISGASRFLEIRVRPSGQAGMTILAPRQLLNSAPYSIKSLNADTAANATNATNASNATNATQLSGQPASFFQNASNLTSGTLNAARFPLPLTLSGTGSNIIGGENASTTNGSSAILGSSSAGTGSTYGVYGESFSTEGAGVYGYAPAASGSNYGGYFRSNSTSGRGVYGVVNSVSGTNYGVYGLSTSTSGRGVFGWAGATSGTIYGVYGQANPLAGGYAVYALGDMGASGTKPFRIDHPFDPENKYLLHYASESPMPQNFYLGNVVTDAEGYAWIELPNYFAHVNVNFKYQLTVVDDPDSAGFVIAKVSKKILGNRFQIRTSAPNVEVSWEVKADRNDLYVRNKKPKDVIEKQGVEKGTYQHPELYGQPPEKVINYDGAAKRPEPVGQSPSPRSKPIVP